MIQYTLENIDPSFPFDEKFYFYKSEKNIVLYNMQSDLGCIFLMGLCISLLKEGKNVIYVSSNNILMRNIYANLLPESGELFVIKSTIRFKELRQIKTKIDVIIFENFSLCKIGAQLKQIFLEFESNKEEEINLLELKNKLLDIIKFLNIPNVIFGNIPKGITLPENNFDYIFEIQNHEHDTIINKKTLIPLLKLKIDDVKNKYSDSIEHEQVIFQIKSQNIQLHFK